MRAVPTYIGRSSPLNDHQLLAASISAAPHGDAVNALVRTFAAVVVGPEVAAEVPQLGLRFYRRLPCYQGCA